MCIYTPQKPYCLNFCETKGHLLLDHISSADTSALTQAMVKHAMPPAYTPLSQIDLDQSPAKVPNVIPSVLQDNEKKEMLNKLNARL